MRNLILFILVFLLLAGCASNSEQLNRIEKRLEFHEKLLTKPDLTAEELQGLINRWKRANTETSFTEENHKFDMQELEYIIKQLELRVEELERNKS